MINFKKFNNLNIGGIIQAGTNVGDEVVNFQNYVDNVIFFEPVFEARRSLHEKIRKSFFKNVFIFDYTLSNQNEYFQKFYLGEETGNSSLFNLNPERSQHHSHNKHKKIITTETITLDHFYYNYKEIINLCNFNFLYMDVQGAEHLIIEGGKNLLKDKIDYIYLEVSHEEIYLGSMLYDDIIELMKKNGYKLLDYEDSIYHGQGDALFIKSK